MIQWARHWRSKIESKKGSASQHWLMTEKIGSMKEQRTYHQRARQQSAYIEKDYEKSIWYVMCMSMWVEDRTYKECQLEWWWRDQRARNCGSSGEAASSRYAAAMPFSSSASLRLLSQIINQIQPTTINNETKTQHHEQVFLCFFQR